MSVVYLLDTNLFRYKVNDNVDQVLYRKAANEFWTQALEKAIIDKATIITSKEVECELRVQMQTLAPRYQALLAALLDEIIIVGSVLPIELEYELRIFSNYIRTPEIRSILEIDGEIGYLKASDARIMVDALMNDAILVTGNVKDFIPYLFFCQEGENKLYDFLNQRFIQIAVKARAVIGRDEKFLALQNKLDNLKT